MTFLEALFGSQYYETAQKGKDGNKGRLNANLFLAALVILFFIAVMMICISFVPGFNEGLSKNIDSAFGHPGGKLIGRILALPFFVIIYLVISRTIGSRENFKGKVETFMQLPDEVKKKANSRVFIPFFILLAIVFGLAMWG